MFCLHSFALFRTFRTFSRKMHESTSALDFVRVLYENSAVFMY